MSVDLDSFQQKVGEWGNETFPHSTPATIMAHLQEEARELLETWEHLAFGEEERIAEETADVFLLLLHLAHRMEFSLADAAVAKMAINRNRTWKATPEPEGHFKHVEEAGS